MNITVLPPSAQAGGQFYGFEHEVSAGSFTLVSTAADAVEADVIEFVRGVHWVRYCHECRVVRLALPFERPDVILNPVGWVGGRLLWIVFFEWVVFDLKSLMRSLEEGVQ